LVEDYERSGHPSTGFSDEHVEKVHKIVNKDQRISISEIAGRLDLSYGTCQ
jgi:hypothetical protein